MPRWEPGAHERLVGAALDLFLEQGYDNTSVAQIAQRAGLTKSSFFRHFPDKPEVLFAGQDAVLGLPCEAIVAAPDQATPLEAVGAGLQALAEVFTARQHPLVAQRQAVIAANSDLQERESVKRATFGTAMRRALRRRGVPDPTATLAAEMGVLAFRAAFTRWADPSNRRAFGDLAAQALEELQTAAASLSGGSPG